MIRCCLGRRGGASKARDEWETHTSSGSLSNRRKGPGQQRRSLERGEPFEGPSLPSYLSDEVQLSSINEHEEAVYDYDYDSNSGVGVGAVRYDGRSATFSDEVKVKVEDEDEDDSRDGRGWRGPAVAPSTTTNVGTGRAPQRQRLPPRPLPVLSRRRDRDLLEFEEAFTKFSERPGDDAAVSAAWAWLAESAREQRVERQGQG